ncbi:uncharacterized protein LOC123658801 [Melitaea cinxia]|uniref:uncharacterized protein LOC123658801 n=1 Tax=Melitaea cinxia TaxID=113334 RepID=UPI0004EA26DE|nr:uncharacterized protein LOC123658801 [Melitaea cinxia]
MRFYIFFSVLIAAVIIAECSHTFMGTNVLRERVFSRKVQYDSYFLRKRVENITIVIPPKFGYQRAIQGILAYDLTRSSASANVTSGGLGFPFVTLRMKSERGLELKYDISVYV